MWTYLWIALGGALGSVARFWCNSLAVARLGEHFPWGTLAVNVAGSFVIGFLGAVAMPGGRLSPQGREFTTQFLMVGVCGGFTTFSAFSLQTLNLLRAGEWLAAGGNVLLSVALCMVAVWLGWLAGSAVGSLKGN